MKKKYILWTEKWFHQDNLINKIARPIINYVIKNSDAYIVPGSMGKKFLQTLNINLNNIHIAPNASYLKISTNHKVLDKGDKVIILYLSRIIKRKGLDYLIKAFSKIEENNIKSHLLIVGDGDFLGETRTLVKNLNIKNICFIGKISEKDKTDFFKIADVFVLPSIFIENAGEPWGLVLNEAMLAGKPIISTTAVAAAYDLIIQGKTGYIVDEKNVEELSKYLTILVKNKQLRENMGLESHQLVTENFNYEQMFNGFIEALKDVNDI